jgi:hypothetical protein
MPRVAAPPRKSAEPYASELARASGSAALMRIHLARPAALDS